MCFGEQKILHPCVTDTGSEIQGRVIEAQNVSLSLAQRKTQESE